jgi:hypothetical protein
MEASNGTVRGVIESLTRVIAALEAAGVEFIYEGTTSSGGGRCGKPWKGQDGPKACARSIAQLMRLGWEGEGALTSPDY